MKTNEGILVENVKRCFLCGSQGLILYEGLRDRIFSAPGIWSLEHCPCCGLVWLNPRPVYEGISEIYKGYYTHSLKNSMSVSSRLRKAIKHVGVSVAFGYDDTVIGPQLLLGQLLDWVKPLRDAIGASIMFLNGREKGRLLDVGCGNGHFLAQMRDLGWQVFGVEPDNEAVKVAKERFDIEVFPGTLEEASLSTESFDAITLYHVIEHMPDPIGLIQECRRLLRVGGRLVVITPNIESLGHKIFRRNWMHLDPPRHFHLLSMRLLRICVERAGMKVHLIRSIARSARWMWPICRLIGANRKFHSSSLKSHNRQLQLEALVFQLLEQVICTFRDVGEENLMIATKEFEQ